MDTIKIVPKDIRAKWGTLTEAELANVKSHSALSALVETAYNLGGRRQKECRLSEITLDDTPREHADCPRRRGRKHGDWCGAVFEEL